MQLGTSDLSRVRFNHWVFGFAAVLLTHGCRLVGQHSHQYLSTTDYRSSTRTHTHTHSSLWISTLPLQPVVKIKHVTVDADVVQVGSSSLELSHQEHGSSHRPSRLAFMCSSNPRQPLASPNLLQFSEPP